MRCHRNSDRTAGSRPRFQEVLLEFAILTKGGAWFALTSTIECLEQNNTNSYHKCSFRPLGSKDWQRWCGRTKVQLSGSRGNVITSENKGVLMHAWICWKGHFIITIAIRLFKRPRCWLSKHSLQKRCNLFYCIQFYWPFASLEVYVNLIRNFAPVPLSESVAWIYSRKPTNEIELTKSRRLKLGSRNFQSLTGFRRGKKLNLVLICFAKQCECYFSHNSNIGRASQHPVWDKSILCSFR